jgi:mono/diheme cytochrome c family protein
MSRLGPTGKRLTAAAVAVMLAPPAIVFGDRPLASDATPPGSAEARFFEEHVRPVLVERCVACHGPDKQKAGLRLDSLVAMLRGGDSGAAITPGDPDASNLVMAIRHDGWEMPPDGRLADPQIAALAEWVRRGAAWPGERPAAALVAEGLPEPEPVGSVVGPPLRARKGTITDTDRDYWAYQPVVCPEVPPLPAGCAPIDRFVLARLATAGIEPLPEAGRGTLVRRLFFDLLGVPPQPADVESFVNDPAADAYDRLVDRLLADPRYGERRARQWLDLVRFAESDGFRQDAFRPLAWRYRDYVVDAFNDDMPYDRFVLEQLAGDELFPGTAGALTATGFLRQTIYEYNQVDVETHRSDILNEVTDATADVFLALGMGCARCHDHKFDPILQRDYYGLQAFLAPLVWDDADLPPSDAWASAQRAYVAGVTDRRTRVAAFQAAFRSPATAPEGSRPEKVWKIGRFPPEIQALWFSPPAGRTPHQEQIVSLTARQAVFLPDGLAAADREAYDALTSDLAEFEKQHAADRPADFDRTMAVKDVGPQPPGVTIPGKPDEAIEPHVPTVLGARPLPPEPRLDAEGRPVSTGRRAALARWIASPDNPLTARVMVNRLWQWHFGRGLVASTSDFGVLGEPPTHPELLDWLAAEFVASGWSVKHLTRLIVTSAAYRRGAVPPVAVAGQAGSEQDGAAADPHNLLLWRQACRRLEAEQIRDAALAISGELDGVTGGPSVPPTKPRRGLYTRLLRNTPHDLCEVFDAPDGYLSCAQRNVTTTPLQSLFLMNGEWMLARARATARALEQQGTASERQLAAEAIRRITGREPTQGRVDRAERFLAERRTAPETVSSHSDVLAQRMPQRSGLAAVIDPGNSAGVLMADGADLPAGDFTIEAHVVLQTLFPDATVRTIASQWSSDQAEPGWSLGVTSEKSRYKPRNLVLQLVGNQLVGTAADGTPRYEKRFEVIASGLHLELQRPYFVAAAVDVSSPGERFVTFSVKDLSDNDTPLLVKKVPHSIHGTHPSTRRLGIGGRDAPETDGRSVSSWDGLIDDVRLSSRVLRPEETLHEAGDPGAAVVAWYTFEETPGFFVDSSRHGRSIVRGDGPAPADAAAPRRFEALVDLCHVLFNSSEFLYLE